jgi:hypothetical protein
MTRSGSLPSFAAALLAAALLFLVSSTMQAQPGGGPGASPAERADRLMKTFAERLALSDSQTVAIRSIVTTSMEQGAKDREQYAGDREAMMQASKERNDKMYAEIEKLLTIAQIEKFTELRDEMRQRAQRFRDRPARGGEQR